MAGSNSSGTYFEGFVAALRFDEPGTYVETDVPIAHTVNYEWDHGLGEIVNAFVDAGFRIESLREYPLVLPSPAVHGQSRDGWWRLPGFVRPGSLDVLNSRSADGVVGASL